MHANASPYSDLRPGCGKERAFPIQIMKIDAPALSSPLGVS